MARSLHSHAPSRILVAQTGFLGDAVLSTPVLFNLRKLYPQATITVLTTPAADEILRAHPAVDDVVVFDKRRSDAGWSGLRVKARELEHRGFDLAVSLHKSWRTAVLLSFSRIPIRIGFRESAAPWLYTHTVSRKHLEHEALRNLAILEPLSGQVTRLDSRLSLGIPDHTAARAAQLLQNLSGHRGLVGIAPGSVWATKRWTASGFASVGETLRDEGYGVVLLGGPADIEDARRVETLMAAPLLNLVGTTTLLESAAVIARLSLLVCNDSAPLHIASAVQTPTVAIFCATVPDFGYGPWRIPAEVVGVAGLTCRPCGRHGGENCPTGTHACQLDVKPRSVLGAINRVLRVGHPQSSGVPSSEPARSELHGSFPRDPLGADR